MPDTDNWKAAWDPVIAEIGRPYRIKPAETRIPDAVERGAIRKYLEPLEFDCALHYDAEIARANGHADVVAPYTALLAFAIPPMWLPGEVLFTSDEPNAQPGRTPIKPQLPDYFPSITGYFATDMDMEFIRAAVVGDVVSLEHGPLLSCEPKETSVGRGAFLKSEMRIVNQHGELLARLFAGSFLYNAHPEA